MPALPPLAEIQRRPARASRFGADDTMTTTSCGVVLSPDPAHERAAGGRVIQGESHNDGIRPSLSSVSTAT